MAKSKARKKQVFKGGLDTQGLGENNINETRIKSARLVDTLAIKTGVERESLLNEAIRLLNSIPEEDQTISDHRRYVITTNQLAAIYINNEKFTEAENYMAKAMAYSLKILNEYENKANFSKLNKDHSRALRTAYESLIASKNIDVREHGLSLLAEQYTMRPSQERDPEIEHHLRLLSSYMRAKKNLLQIHALKQTLQFTRGKK